MLKVVVLILLAETWHTAGQIFFKRGTNSLEPSSLRGLGAHISFLKKLASKGAIWLGFGSMAVGFLIWLAALARADLSIVSPLGSMQYILVMVSAHFFLGEKISLPKLAGTLLVVAGVVLVSIS